MYTIIRLRSDEMGINIITNISEKFKETKITIEAPNLSKEVQNFINYVENSNGQPSQIIASKDNKIHFIELKNIICFFSEDKYNYLRTKEDTYKIKYKLYELEELLNTQKFIRISKSCIINIEQVKYFNIGILNTIIVELKDNTKETVTKKYFKQIMNLLKERGI